MKTRIISALIGVPLLCVALYFNNTILWNIAVALIAVVAVYELLRNTKYIGETSLLLICLIYTALVPFSHTKYLKPYATLFMMLFVAALLIVLFMKHETLPFTKIAVCFTGTVFVSHALSSLVFLRDMQTDDRKFGIGLYLIILAFICAWISDAGAYFIGRAFGRHKLAPHISPKKTVEGAIGGVVFCVIFSIAFTYVYFDILRGQGTNVEINLLDLVIVSFVASLVGIVGDLTASIIKRQTGIKDFGNIIPGHGGAMDRFDSIMMIAPFLYVLLQIFGVVTLV